MAGCLRCGVPALLLFALMTSAVRAAPGASAGPPPYTFRLLAERHLRSLDALPDMDADGYGELAWGVSYGMMALNVLYEATGDTRFLARQADLVERVLGKRDSNLAAAHGSEAYVDYQRGRVLRSWGTSHYSAGRHTCWLVHAGMLLYPMAEYVRLVQAGGDRTRPWLDRARRVVPAVEETIAEFDAEWRDGPQPGQGYYVFPSGDLAPNNQMNAPGRALFVLADVTGKTEYRDRARKLAAYFRSKLTHVADGDYYIWAYSQQTPDGPPGRGEDVSHAAINAHFAYVAWEHGASFTDTDMARLARTLTHGLYLGGGEMAATLGGREPNDDYTGQCGRWGFLARFDPLVETAIRDYIASHPRSGALSGTTGALGYAYLLRARGLRGAVAATR
ncbi:MAG TPA: hypothetical protein PLD23_15190 [Armatimonadota bacterium]|nr:hypothetical protein [Armatimonadota bacterium]